MGAYKRGGKTVQLEMMALVLANIISGALSTQMPNNIRAYFHGVLTSRKIDLIKCRRITIGRPSYPNTCTRGSLDHKPRMVLSNNCCRLIFVATTPSNVVVCDPFPLSPLRQSDEACHPRESGSVLVFSIGKCFTPRVQLGRSNRKGYDGIESTLGWWEDRENGHR